MRIIALLIGVGLILLVGGCGDESTVDPDPSIAPRITYPVSGAQIDRLKIDVRGTAEPDRIIEIFVDNPNNVTSAYTNSQGFFAAEDLPLGGQGRRVIWARVANDTILVSQPILVDVDLASLAYPIILFPPHDSKIPAGAIPLGGVAPDGVTEVEIYRDGAIVTTVEVAGGSFFSEGFEPTGVGDVLLYARGVVTPGVLYTAYGESIRVRVGGGESPQLEAVTNPSNDSLFSSEQVVVEGSASDQAKLALFLNGGDTGLRTTSVGGNFSFVPLSLLSDGAHLIGIVSIRGSDPFAEGAIRLWADFTSPFSPTILHPEEGEIFRSPSVLVEGASEPDATVYFRLDDDWLDPISTTSSGAFSVSMNLGGDGQYSLVAKAKDRAGNESALSSELLIAVDSSAPWAPMLSAPSDGELVSAGSIFAAGRAQQGSWLELLVDGRVEVSQWVTLLDTFAISMDTPLPDGRHRLAVRASSEPGAGWVRGDSSTIYVDLFAPSAPLILQPPESSYVSSETLTLSGSSEPGASVTVLMDGEEGGETIADQLGVWGLSLSTPVEDGPVAFQASATDTAGHVGVMGAIHTLLVDKTGPTLEILQPASDSLFSSNPVFVMGSSDPEAIVWVGGESVAVNNEGVFEEYVYLAEGLDTVVVAAEDVAGNTTKIHLPLRLDTTAPFIVLTSPPESLITQSTNVTVAGTTEPGAQLTIQGGAVNVDPAGAFSTGVAVSYGWNTIEIEATDQAGWENTLTRTVIADAVPTIPSDLDPDRGELVNTGRPILTMSPASDGNGDPLTYTMEIYADAELSVFVTRSPTLQLSENYIQWAVQPELDLDGSLFHWRARAFDGVLHGEWSEVATFRVHDIGSRDPHRFFGYGDSITEGAQTYNGGWIPTVGYRQALALALSSFFGESHVARKYVSGGSSDDGLENIQADLAGEIGGFLLLLFGAIDAGAPDMNAAESATNVIDMADYASSLNPGMVVIIGNVPPSRDAARDARIQILNAQLAIKAEEAGYPFADHYSAIVVDAAGQIDSVVCEDGIHPNDRGYAVMAGVWFKTIIGSETYPLPADFYLVDPPRVRARISSYSWRTDLPQILTSREGETGGVAQASPEDFAITEWAIGVVKTGCQNTKLLLSGPQEKGYCKCEVKT